MSAAGPPPGSYAVLGASGLMGFHALSTLADRPGISVRAVWHSRRPAVAATNIAFVQADLEDPLQALRVLSGCDYGLLFAGVVASAPVLARDPVGPVLRGLRISLNALEAAATSRMRKCVWLGTTTAFPDLDRPLLESDLFGGEPPGNWHLLGHANRFAERVAMKLASGDNPALRLAVLRPSLIYGEHDHFDEAQAHFLPSLIRRVVSRESPIEVWGDGKQERDLVHAEDVVRAAFLALSQDRAYADYNIASGASVSVNACLETLLRLDGFKDARIEHRYDKPSSHAKRVFSCAKARDELGFAPTVGLQEGLSRTLAWYRGSLAV